MLQIDHINIHARDPRAMVGFLEAVLGAREGERPPFKHPGHWVYLDGRPMFHIDHAQGGESRGLIDHIAIGVFDFDVIMAKIETAGLPHHLAGIPGGVGQVFVEGPEGLKLELQYHRPAGT